MRQRADFEALLRTGARFTSRNFVVRAGPNGQPHARLGIIAGKKAAARAVDRNRAKRLIREVFRMVSGDLASLDIAVQLRNDLRVELNRTVRDELAELLETLVRRIASERAPPSDRH
jgi:ribonuclease P protein component